MSELPKGWTVVNLAEIASDISYGFTDKATMQPVGPKFLRITDIQDGRVDWASVPHCRSHDGAIGQYSLKTGDIVFARTGATTGKSFLIESCPTEAVFASYLIRVRIHTGLCAALVAYFFRSADYWQQITENLSGSAQPSCNASKLALLGVPVAPIAEQRRILVKLDLLLSRVNACQQRLDKVPKLLARFRQSVLAAACSGGLTADWRIRNPAHTDTIGDVNRFRLSSRKSKMPVAEPLPMSRIPDVQAPASWSWAEFGSLIGELRNGISTRPEMNPPGTAILRISAVRPGSVDPSGSRFLKNAQALVPQYRLRDGDLLFTRYNGSLELLGVCGLVRDFGSSVVLYPDKLMRVRIDHPYLIPEFVEIYFRDHAVHDGVISKAKSSAGQNGVSGSDIKSQPFPLPTTSEQTEIVRRVAQMFAFADTLETRVATARKRVEALTQSILAKAFRGELVPTEAELAEAEGREYETASMLLERVKSAANHRSGSDGAESTIRKARSVRASPGASKGKR